MKKRLFHWLPALALLAAPLGAHAATFTSSAALDAAIAGATSDTFQNFGSLTDGASVPNGTTLGGATLSFSPAGATVIGYGNEFPGGLALGGTNEGFSPGNTVTVTFATPVDFFGIFSNTAEPATASLTDGVETIDTTSTTYDTNTFIFRGIVSSDGFTSATFTETSGDFFSITGFVYGTLPSPVPEPASLMLLGGAMFGFGVIRHQLRRQAGGKGTAAS